MRNGCGFPERDIGDYEQVRGIACYRRRVPHPALRHILLFLVRVLSRGGYDEFVRRIA